MTAPRYQSLLKIASGGTATVYVGTAAGALGFRQLVALKRPHAHLADDPDFREALVREARIASRLHHANVVDVRDVEIDGDGLQLVMDYVEGASLGDLIRSWVREKVPARPHAVAIRIVLDACAGLGALHDLEDEEGQPLGLVHRDVSPANILVGLDGVARLADFGLAKALSRRDLARTTTEGTLRGKLGYMAPEYIRGKPIDARVDVFAMGIVLWETLARKRLFRGETELDTLERVQHDKPAPIDSVTVDLAPEAASALEGVLGRALSKDPERRYARIAEFAAELESVARAHDLVANHADVRASFAETLRAELEGRRRAVQSALAAPEPQVVPPSLPPLVPASMPPPTVPAFTASTQSLPPRPRRPVLPWVLGLGGMAAVLVVAASGLPTRSASVAAKEPRLFSSALSPRGEEARALAEMPAASASVSPLKPARTAPSTTVPEPGNKPPRPNPYAKVPR